MLNRVLDGLTRAAGERPARCLSRALGAFTWSLLAACAVPSFAHTDSPGSLPLKPYSLRLNHRRPADIVALFGQEQFPNTESGHVPRAVVVDSPESLLPGGTISVYRTQTSGELVIVATEGSANVEACIQELDVPVQSLGPGQERVVLTLRHASAPTVRASVLRLPDAGVAVVTGRQLVLEGKPAWLHRALRQVIRGELGVPVSTSRLLR